MQTALVIAYISAALILIALIYELARSLVLRRRDGRRAAYELDRHGGNPVLSPLPFREWEANGSFNPAAIMDDESNVHLLYRAIGGDGLSRIGHAVSKSGVHFSERSAYPVFVPTPGVAMPDPRDALHPVYDPLVHISGGGWGGAEDPRAVRVGDRVYMTYTAFEGWDNMRIGLTSISMADLKGRRWNWRRPVLISPKKARAKNWVIFPEKINGKFAILHAVAPKVLVAYVDDLNMVPVIESSPDHYGYGHCVSSRKGFWDETTKGAGTPPIKTDRGWLLLYHAVQPGKYLVGAMLLDLNDPTRILYRSPQPILSPDARYENEGKPGIVYATGAVVKNGQLMVYYGGGDKHGCVAQTPLAPLLDWLVKYGKV